MNDSAPDAARHAIGGNAPPDPIELRRDELQETHADLIARCEQLLGLAERLPTEMNDDWEAKITEAIKSCTKFSRNSEATRLDANEPYRALIAATDGFFKALSDKVDRLKAKMTKEYLTPYQQAKADAEKRRRDEEARIAKAKADEEERIRREEAARLAEAKRQEEAARREAERLEREAADAEARVRAREARLAADKAEAERREQQRIAAEARDKAIAATQEKNVTAKSAKANAADRSRTRTDLGAVASLRTTWKFEIVDRDAVPRSYLAVSEPAINAAIRAATVDGRCSLRIDGVHIFPVTDSVVR